ncbi:phage antirepressor KilAC domain-containing protein [Hymenobacter wooponensis]|uniref:Antirepressor protein C-terminal domain-containing protein n=1 Tax=Hymenobacter wooponensis TaxID=1525360 RepID=A0A4Z0MLU2_9BACT|nr:phage antirepressor KilAC domain-containing protein [Hymenobacter wooponensis]TGD80822.1 hypothetical protein EU557_13545 [Hymenobacter wooponensis]
MDTLIQLQDGPATTPAKLQKYFTRILQAERSGQEFCVNLHDIFRIGYARKDNAVKALRKGYLEDVDYQVVRNLAENSQGGRPEEIYLLTLSCAEHLAVRANREVFEIYRQCRQAIQQLITTPTLPDFTDPAAMARIWASDFETKRAQQQQIEQITLRAEASHQANLQLMQKADKQKAEMDLLNQKIESQAKAVEAIAFLTDSQETYTLEEAAKIAGIGRATMMKALREKGILLKSSGLPAAAFRECFDVKRDIYTDPFSKTDHPKMKILITAVKGMALLKRLFG